jgi:hypothetical protein
MPFALPQAARQRLRRPARDGIGVSVPFDSI